MNNRILNILVPGIGLPLSLGTVYNYSQYSVNITSSRRTSVSP